MGARKKPADGTADEALKVKRELFCRYYTQSGENFGNATLSYADAFDYDLESLSKEDILDPETGAKIEDSEYDKQYHVCSVMASRLLRNDDIQARITVLLNELLKDEVVDSELAKIIRQDKDNSSKVAAIREYNKLRGRILDKTQTTIIQSATMGDLDQLLSILPKERRDYFYDIIRTIIAEAEQLRGSAATPQGGGTQ